MMTTEEQEYHDALKRAFVGQKADFITIDGWSGRFLTAAFSFGERRGWLTSSEGGGDQYTAIIGHLTPEGRAAFGLPPLEAPIDWRCRAEAAEKALKKHVEYAKATEYWTLEPFDQKERQAWLNRLAATGSNG